MARLRFLMNEGDGDYCALYVDNEKAFESWTGPTDVEDLLRHLTVRLNGRPIDHLSVEYTNLPFYDDDENELEKQEWPATIGDLPED